MLASLMYETPCNSLSYILSAISLILLAFEMPIRPTTALMAATSTKPAIRRTPIFMFVNMVFPYRLMMREAVGHGLVLS
jgi:hypothetical protein